MGRKRIKCPHCGEWIYSVRIVGNAYWDESLESGKERNFNVMDGHEERCVKCDEIIKNDVIDYEEVIKNV